MEHRASNDLEWKPSGYEHFTGSAWFGPLAPQPTPTSLNAFGVLFEPGARTDWHEHPEGQVLYIVSGAGKVRSKDGETVIVRAGDAVYAPPGEVHWHGALPGSYMMHLSLTTGGATQWHETKVSDEEYSA